MNALRNFRRAVERQQLEQHEERLANPAALTREAVAQALKRGGAPGTRRGRCDCGAPAIPGRDECQRCMDASSAADLVSSHDVVRFVEARVETSGDDIALAFSMPLSSAFSVLSKLARDGRILRLARGRFGGRES